MISPRAADDFAIIRARLEELRRQRARAAPKTRDRPESGPKSYDRAQNGETGPEGHRPHARFTKSSSDKASSAHKSPKHLRLCAP